MLELYCLNQANDKTIISVESDGAGKQPDTQTVRKRLTKLFEFLKAYTDLRYPSVRDINQQLRTLWLKDLPAHPSVELFRDTGKTDDDGEDSDIVRRATQLRADSMEGFSTVVR